MNQDRYEWVHDLIKAEEQLAETGIVDYELALNPERILVAETLTLLTEIRQQIQEAAEIFNDSKPTTQGRIKIYSIAKTPADFMIFRNGYKLIFSFKKPGAIAIKFHFMDSLHAEDEHLEIKWGAFNDVIWQHRGQPLRLDFLVRHFMVKFTRESVQI